MGSSNLGIGGRLVLNCWNPNRVYEIHQLRTGCLVQKRKENTVSVIFLHTPIHKIVASFLGQNTTKLWPLQSDDVAGPTRWRAMCVSCVATTRTRWSSQTEASFSTTQPSPRMLLGALARGFICFAPGTIRFSCHPALAAYALPRHHASGRLQHSTQPGTVRTVSNVDFASNVHRMSAHVCMGCE